MSKTARTSTQKQCKLSKQQGDLHLLEKKVDKETARLDIFCTDKARLRTFKLGKV